MSKSMKIWIIIGVILLLIGSLIFTGVMVSYEWDFTKLSTVEYETNKFDISETVNGITIFTDTADIEFCPSENGEAFVECYEQKNLNHLVSVTDGMLSIKIVDTRKWYENIGIFFDSQKIKVFIPKGTYGKLKIESDTGEVNLPSCFNFDSVAIKESTGNVTCHASAEKAVNIQTSTGKIHVENIECSSLDLRTSTGNITVKDINVNGKVSISVSTGKTTINNVACEGLSSSGSTGDISLSNVISTGEFYIERDTGDVRFDACDASEISVKTDTGDVSGSLLSEKVFITETDTGTVNVPKTVNGGRCEIVTDTGDIKFTVK